MLFTWSKREKPEVKSPILALASSASSGVAPSTTIAIRSLRCGNASANAISRWRHGTSLAISFDASVLIAKWVIA